MYKRRSYRSWAKSADLKFFEVVEKETDLAIYADKDLTPQARAAVLNSRRDLEEYIRSHPSFYSALEPVEVEAGAPEIIKRMADAGRRAGVGPMAAVAGAVAESVGRELCRFSYEVIVENGGDIFIRTKSSRRLGIYAGENSSFTGKLAIEVGPAQEGLGVCTSSGTVSHSLSFGKSDAVMIISKDTALADAVATLAGNLIKGPADIEKSIAAARAIDGVLGVVAIVGDKMGTWGEIKLV